MLAVSGFGRKRFLFNAPKAIHRVLVENTANYARTPATIRILGPIVGNGLLLSKGEDWRHQRRTIAPALPPRVMPMLTRHVASAAQETIARLAAGPTMATVFRRLPPQPGGCTSGTSSSVTVLRSLYPKVNRA